MAKRIILAGCLIAAVTYLPLAKGLTHFLNPARDRYQQNTPMKVAASDGNRSKGHARSSCGGVVGGFPDPT